VYLVTSVLGARRVFAFVAALLFVVSPERFRRRLGSARRRSAHSSDAASAFAVQALAAAVIRALGRATRAADTRSVVFPHAGRRLSVEDRRAAGRSWTGLAPRLAPFIVLLDNTRRRFTSTPAPRRRGHS
jgi:hypothetical protein